MWRGVIEEYRSYLPVTDRTPIVTLLEGGTPLLPSRLNERLGIRLWMKYEATNPTGSFKDRGMTVAVSKALEGRARGVICASTGNTAASAAAYAARAGLPCVLVVPAEGVAAGKLVQSIAHGGVVIPVAAGFDQALDLARSAAEPLGLVLVNSVNPDRLAGQQTAVFEICDALARVPEAIVIPVGNAGNITAYWMGLKAYRAQGRIDRLPRLIGVQAEGAAPLVRRQPVHGPRTVASAIRIGRPASWVGAVQAVEESEGEFVVVSDEEILLAQRDLAREGLFAEPASAAALAGVYKLVRRTSDVPSQVICILTGHGLKDPEIIRTNTAISQPIAPTIEALVRAVGAVEPT